MPLFRRKSEKTLPKTSSLSVYGKGRRSTSSCSNSGDKSSDSSSISSLNLEDKQQPFLAFAEATFNSSLPLREKSRLSKTLDEVIYDNSALAYFIQFMEAKRAKHLIKFWLEAESFSASASTRLNGQPTSASEIPVVSVPLPSSDSSGCISEKSDEVFLSSSRTIICDPTLSEKTNSNSSTQRCLCTLPARTTDIKESPQKCMQLCNSLKKQCNISSVSTEKSSNGPTEKKTAKNNVNSVGKTKLVPSVKSAEESNSVPCSESLHDYVDSLHYGEWTEEAERYFSQQPDQSSENLVRLHTSMEQDAQCIYRKYIAQDAQFPIGINEELRSITISNICRPNGKVDPYCFVLAQKFVVQRMDKEFFPSFLRSSFHCKHQIDVLTSGNVYIADVLYNDSALFFFMEFMEQENVRHLVDFLLMADNFRNHLMSQQGSYDGILAQGDAMVIYDKYFSLQATSSLGFSDSIRYEIEQNICREEGPLPNCFLKPVMILMQYLEKTYLLQFLSSQLYFKYISECIITIQSGGADFNSQPKYSGSDSGSEHSLPISSVNTLLAMDGKQPGTSSKILRNIGEQDMRIDTGQFKPDSLWKRHLAGSKLQMAHVDHLGKVITEFEPEPDRRRESRISKAVKKLVNWEDDKNQEDIAWKVAEMIVKDVCSVTMSDSSLDPKDTAPGVT